LNPIFFFEFTASDTLREFAMNKHNECLRL
jgi:hypothetical protein